MIFLYYGCANDEINDPPNSQILQNIHKMKFIKIEIHAPVVEIAGDTSRYYSNCFLPMKMLPAYLDTSLCKWVGSSFTYTKIEAYNSWAQNITISSILSDNGEEVLSLFLAHTHRLGSSDGGPYTTLDCGLNLANISKFSNDSLYYEYRYMGNSPNSVIKSFRYTKAEKNNFMYPVVNWVYSGFQWSDTAYISVIFTSDKSIANY